MGMLVSRMLYMLNKAVQPPVGKPVILETIP
jgi:hypothetical protein